MMRVYILFPRALKEPQGLSKVVCLLNDNKGLFNKYGIDLDVISRDTIVGESISYEDGRISTYPSVVSRIRRFLMDVMEELAKKYSIIVKFRFKKSFFDWSSKVVSFFLKQNIPADVLFFHDIFTCYDFLKRKEKKNVKVICVVHSIGIPMYGIDQQYPYLKGSSFYRRIEDVENYVMQNVDAYGFVSKMSVDNFMKCRPEYKKEKLFYVHNGMPDITLEHSHAIDKYEIICVGGLCYQKGQWRIVDALIKMNNENKFPSNIHISFVGSGDMQKELENKIKSNGLGEYFSFVGQVNNVDYYLSNSSIFLLPTSNDGLPMAIIEAMRAGLPIVSTRVGGIPELVDENVTGLFIEPTVEGVISFLDTIEKYDWVSMGSASRRKFLKEYTIEAMVGKYSQILQDVIKHE